MSDNPNLVKVIDSTGSPTVPLVMGMGEAKAVVSPATGALHRTMNLIKLEGGSSTIAMTHASDAVYYVAAGHGRVANDHSGETYTIAEGAMVHVDAGDTYLFVAGEEAGLTILGGPCPADLELYTRQEV